MSSGKFLGPRNILSESVDQKGVIERGRDKAYITINVAMAVVNGFLENAIIPTVDEVCWTLNPDLCKMNETALTSVVTIPSGITIRKAATALGVVIDRMMLHIHEWLRRVHGLRPHGLKVISRPVHLVSGCQKVKKSRKVDGLPP